MQYVGWLVGRWFVDGAAGGDCVTANVHATDAAGGDVDEVAVGVAVAHGDDVAATKDVVAEVFVADAGWLTYVCWLSNLLANG